MLYIFDTLTPYIYDYCEVFIHRINVQKYLLYSFIMLNSSASVMYYIITYVIKSIVFFYILTFWKSSDPIKSMFMFFVAFVAMDFILVRFLPNCEYKKKTMNTMIVPDNFYVILGIDYVVKAIVWYYAYIYYYLSLNTAQQVMMIFIVMAGIDTLFAYLLMGMNPRYSEQFMCICSM